MDAVNNDILQVNGKTYALTEVNCGDVDIRREMEEMYTHKTDEYKRQFNDGLVEEGMTDWNTQINHIKTVSENNEVVVPQNMFGKPVSVYDKRLIELRAIVYEPNEMLCSPHSLKYEGVDHSFVDDMCVREGYGDNDNIIVTFQVPFILPQLIGFNAVTNKLYSPWLRTYHTFSHTEMCTGDHNASDFWSLTEPQFSKEMNRINLFSPACKHMSVGGVNYYFSTILNRDTFISVERRESSWNVSA